MRKYLSILAGLLFAGVVLAQKGTNNMNNQASKFSVDETMGLDRANPSENGYPGIRQIRSSEKRRRSRVRFTPEPGYCLRISEGRNKVDAGKPGHLHRVTP